MNGVWTYVYDGAAAHEYFSADEVANLYTSIGQTCFQPPPLPGNDYIALQAIGSTNTWELYSNWNGSIAGIDQTQTGDTSMAPLVVDAGLVAGSGAPWATTLSLLLNYDPALQSASPSPYYYRMSVVQADASGKPMAGATPVTLMTPLSWAYFDTATNPVSIASQPLGPVTVGGNQGLYQIPYFGGTNPAWLGNQFHQQLDTTSLANVIAGGPGVGNGQFLLILEVFDAGGNRLVPAISTPTPTDTKATFNYVRLLTSTTTANVPFNSLAHVLWVDNRPVVGAIEYFMNSSGTQVCQFYQGKPDTPFYVGFQAYHAVMCDASPSPQPASWFLSSFDLTWQEGLCGNQRNPGVGGRHQLGDRLLGQCRQCPIHRDRAVDPASLQRAHGDLRGNAGSADHVLLCSDSGSLSEAHERKRRHLVLRVDHDRGPGVVRLKHFHFWCLQSDCAKRGFSSRKAALRCAVLFRVEVKCSNPPPTTARDNLTCSRFVPRSRAPIWSIRSSNADRRHFDRRAGPLAGRSYAQCRGRPIRRLHPAASRRGGGILRPGARLLLLPQRLARRAAGHPCRGNLGTAIAAVAGALRRCLPVGEGHPPPGFSGNLRRN